MRSQLKEFFSSLMLALAFAFLFQTTAFATFFIPSESMVPTLEVGDRLTASKFAYGWSRYSLPFGLTLPASLGGRVLAQAPSRVRRQIPRTRTAEMCYPERRDGTAHPPPMFLLLVDP